MFSPDHSSTAFWNTYSLRFVLFLSLIMFMAPKNNFWGLISLEVFYCKEMEYFASRCKPMKTIKTKTDLMTHLYLLSKWAPIPGHLDQAPLSLAVITIYQETFSNAWRHWAVQTREEVSRTNAEWVLGSIYAVNHPIMRKQLQERVVCSTKTSCLTVKKFYLQSFTTSGPHAKLTDIPILGPNSKLTELEFPGIGSWIGVWT